MRTDRPRDRLLRIIAPLILEERIFSHPATSFSTNRDITTYHGVSITVTTRIDSSDNFFIAIEL